jgi:peptidoglycan/LPS O-acetylase OafA/YrhL
MLLAEKYYKDKEIKIPQKSILFLASAAGILITGITGTIGGIYKVFNDIPAMIGYGALSLLLYSFNVSFFNNLFEKINYVSYEWYLTHILVFSIIFNFPLPINKYLIGIMALLASLIISWAYKILIFRLQKIKNNCLIEKVS